MSAPAAAAPCIHRPERPLSGRALSWGLSLTLLFAATEAVGGLLAHSLALLADGWHMFADAGSLGLSLFALWIARRPVTASKTYGYYRLEILAALVNGALLIAVTVGIVLEAIRRLQQPQPVHPGLMAGVAALGLAANLATMSILHRAQGESLNLRGAYLHVLSDVLGSAGALVAAGIILATGWVSADPIVSLVISALILVSSTRLVLDSVDVLLEATPRHVSMPDLETAIASVPSVRGVHDLHVWTVSSGIIAMSGHATVPDAAQHQEVLEEITRRVRHFGIQHVTVQLEKAQICE